jgi:phytoene dehydrogenase-like protein
MVATPSALGKLRADVPRFRPTESSACHGAAAGARGARDKWYARYTVVRPRLACWRACSARAKTIKRMVEGYDAADPDRASTFALRDEWMGHGLGRQGRIAGGYGALIKFLVSECRRQGASIHLGSAVTAIDESRGRIAACCHDGATLEADAAILTVPLPVLPEIALPQAVREKAAASTEIGFGNVVKILLRFTTKWCRTIGVSGNIAPCLE